MMEDEFDEPCYMVRDDGAKGWKDPGLFIRQPTDMAEGVRAWINTDYAAVLMALADAFDLELIQVCERFGEINLRSSKDKDVKDWLWHPLLGVFRALN
ncbi:CRISPR-associated helicase Cas3, subtype I-F/YPEST [Leclercia adecarboxylata]|nr:CRISPR-associated helicase Cas3, subtype I-F/YPEST [Leclercia adecarboxylata]